MKLSALAVIASCTAALSGCVVPDHHHHRPHAAKVVVPVPAVAVPVPVLVPVVEKHCPPGQAKKGKC